jgi:protein transport protein SEC23
MTSGMYGTQPAGAGQAIFTDDVSLQVFMEHLKRLVSLFRECCPRHMI